VLLLTGSAAACVDVSVVVACDVVTAGADDAGCVTGGVVEPVGVELGDGVEVGVSDGVGVGVGDSHTGTATVTEALVPSSPVTVTWWVPDGRLMVSVPDAPSATVIVWSP
jgi:hypothetical protein